MSSSIPTTPPTPPTAAPKKATTPTATLERIPGGPEWSSTGLRMPPEQLLLQRPAGLWRVDEPQPIAPQPRHVALATRVPSLLQSPPSPVPAPRESASEQLPRRPPRTSTCFQGKNERPVAKVLGLTTWGPQPREGQSDPCASGPGTCMPEAPRRPRLELRRCPQTPHGFPQDDHGTLARHPPPGMPWHPR